MSQFQGKRMTCFDCGTFIWTASEQAFFAEKGLTESPERCKAYRQAHKVRRNDERQKGDKR